MPVSQTCRSIEEEPGSIHAQHEDMFILHCDGPWLFFNVDFVRDRIFELLAHHDEGVKLAIFSRYDAGN